VLHDNTRFLTFALMLKNSFRAPASEKKRNGKMDEVLRAFTGFPIIWFVLA